MNLKQGDVVVCIDDDSSDEDVGMSGLVLRGRRDLKLGKEYIIEDIDYRHVPTDMSYWEPAEHNRIKYYWTLLKLKNVPDTAWAHLFERKHKDGANQILNKNDFD